MSEDFVNQITLDCLLNKELYHNQIKNKKSKSKQINKEERNFYRKRIFNLFKEMINNNSPQELPQDVKYAYDNFIESTIHYFKTIDNNDIIQSEYKDITNVSLQDTSSNTIDVINADKLMMRSIKVDDFTLDKYVKRKNTKEKEELILPKQKELNLRSAEFKNKGIKDNITNIYEGNNQKK